MGLLKDALGPAFRVDQVNNGMNGPLRSINKSFGKGSNVPSLDPERPPPMPPKPSDQYYARDLCHQRQDTLSSRELRNLDRSRQREGRRDSRWSRNFNDDRRSYHYPGQRMGDYALSSALHPDQAQVGKYQSSRERSFHMQEPKYDLPTDSRTLYDEDPQHEDQEYARHEGQPYLSPTHWKDVRFRPLALPQIAYGEGKPFLRGYSNELMQYGISKEAFVQVVDKINQAIVPNPEVQIFQKAAQITDYFV